MPKGVCDPSPEPYNEMGLSVLNGQVSIVVRWTWDGVSVYPDCDGPITEVVVTNTTAQDVTFNVPFARKANGRTYTLPASQTVTISSPGQLRQLGYETITDTENLTITQV